MSGFMYHTQLYIHWLVGIIFSQQKSKLICQVPGIHIVQFYDIKVIKDSEKIYSANYFYL